MALHGMGLCGFNSLNPAFFESPTGLGPKCFQGLEPKLFGGAWAWVMSRIRAQIILRALKGMGLVVFQGLGPGCVKGPVGRGPGGPQVDPDIPIRPTLGIHKIEACYVYRK